MPKKIYVGNLSFQMTENDLNDLFTEFGNVESAQIITDRSTGRSKGFGFVQMADDEAADKAIERLNGKEVKGRALTVNEARPREEKDSSRGGGGGGGGGRRGGHCGDFAEQGARQPPGQISNQIGAGEKEPARGGPRKVRRQHPRNKST